jgi:hypothetical protein
LRPVYLVLSSLQWSKAWKLQATNDGSKCLWTFLYLWGQHVCDT